MKFSFTLNKMPVTQQQKGVTVTGGKPRFYNRKGTENYELRTRLFENKPKEPIKGAVRLVVLFEYKTSTKSHIGKYKVTRPDLDNLMKNLQDYMTEYKYWEDDSYVCDTRQIKKWGMKNKISILVEKLEE